jgi:hypothetical protein
VASVINRYYDPITDQFLSVDRYVAWTHQAYAFVNDDPLNLTDPLGLKGWYCILGVSHYYSGNKYGKVGPGKCAPSTGVGVALPVDTANASSTKKGSGSSILVQVAGGVTGAASDLPGIVADGLTDSATFLSGATTIIQAGTEPVAGIVGGLIGGAAGSAAGASVGATVGAADGFDIDGPGGAAAGSVVGTFVGAASGGYIGSRAGAEIAETAWGYIWNW